MHHLDGGYVVEERGMKSGIKRGLTAEVGGVALVAVDQVVGFVLRVIVLRGVGWGAGRRG